MLVSRSGVVCACGRALATGFDFAAEAPSMGHYWEKIFKLRTVHSYRRERTLMLQLVSTGRVKVLR